jgi:hypothetical protein
MEMRKNPLNMGRFIPTILLFIFVPSAQAIAQQPPSPAATPADYILLTVIMRHDQSKNLDEINRLQDGKKHFIG